MSERAGDPHAAVRDYYGRVLGGSGDLKTTAACDPAALPDALKRRLSRLHPEVLARYFGCGTLLPEALEGRTVLDLGCGSGRDVYLLAQLVGPTGRVIGLDMTPEQLAVARGTLEWHRAAFGAECPRIEFLDGRIEALEAIGLGPGTVDVIVSNCVINLSPDKPAVLSGARSLLRDGGEMYFADVYAERPVPEALRDDPVMIGECLAGALDWDGFGRIAAAAGFAAPRIVATRPLAITDDGLAARLDGLRFASVTCRLFAATQDGADAARTARAKLSRPLPDGAETLALDAATTIGLGSWTLLPGELAHALSRSRFAGHLEIERAPGARDEPAAERLGATAPGAGVIDRSDPGGRLAPAFATAADSAGCCR